MPRKKKLKVGDIVRASFLGTMNAYRVIEVTDKKSYKLECVTSGTRLPGVTWKADMEKKSVWFIDGYLGHETVPKSTEDQNTKQHTTDKNELDAAIRKQKDFIRGKAKK